MKIAMIAPVIGGGIKTQLEHVVPILKTQGHDVTVLTFDSYSGGLVTIQSKAFGIPFGLYRFAPNLLFKLSEMSSKWDVLHVHGYPCYAADLLTVFRFLHKTPMVLTLHGSFHQYESMLSYYTKKIHNSVMKNFSSNVEKIVAVSYAEKAIVSKMGLPSKKIDVIYNGIDSPKFSGVCPSQNSEHATNKTVLFVGRLSSTKNVKMLIEAMQKVIQKIKDVQLIIAGADWGERENLERQASRLGIGRYTKFLGDVTEAEKFSLLRSSSVFVSPSLQDIFSIALLEACVASLPVIAFNLGGNPEMVQNGKTGILVNEPTSSAIAKSIMDFLDSDEKTRKLMGSNARDFVLNKFSWQQTAIQLYSAYQDVLRR